MESTKKCSVKKCSNEHYGLGLCRMHWMRLRRRGRTDTPPTRGHSPEKMVEIRRAKQPPAKPICHPERNHYGKGLCHSCWVTKWTKANPAAYIAQRLRSRLCTAIRNGQKRGSAVSDLGCTIKEFMVHISNAFEPGMSWTNWGDWHLDHIRPLASFNLNDREQFLEACHYTNIRPLWKSENCSRNNHKWK